MRIFLRADELNEAGEGSADGGQLGFRSILGLMVGEARAEAGLLCLGELSEEEGAGYSFYPLVCAGERYGWVGLRMGLGRSQSANLLRPYLQIAAELARASRAVVSAEQERDAYFEDSRSMHVIAASNGY